MSKKELLEYNKTVSNLKLTTELVPKSSWYDNVRSNVSKEQWDYLRKKCYKNANYKCEICGSIGLEQGYNYPVECHEIWDFNNNTETQTLKGLIALCPYCHKVKHIGLAEIMNELDICYTHFKKVNNVKISFIMDYFEQVKLLYRERSKIKWKLDISLIDNY